MDVYTRRRTYVLRESDDDQGYVAMSSAMEICFEMLQHASLDDGGPEVATTTRAHAQAQAHAHTQDIVEHHSDATTFAHTIAGGVHGFALSKSLQGMADILFQVHSQCSVPCVWHGGMRHHRMGCMVES